MECVRGAGGGRGRKGEMGLIAIAGDDGREIGWAAPACLPACLPARVRPHHSMKDSLFLGRNSIHLPDEEGAHVQQVGWMAVEIAIGLVRSRSRAMKNLSHFMSVGRSVGRRRRRPRMRN